MTDRHYITISDPVSEKLRKDVETREDINGLRLRRLLHLPDLSRKERSPIKYIVDAVLALDMFAQFDVMQFPEIVSIEDNFDILNTPPDHPSRKETDTYYVDDTHVLRTHTTTMWPYYLRRKETKDELEQEGEVGLLAHGKVFRKDEIDRNHFPVFHQVDGLYICKKEKHVIGIPELQEVLAAITKAIYGDSITYRFLEDTFPFTNPSTQIEIEVVRKRNDEEEKEETQWLEVVGAGVVHTEVLNRMGVNPDIYNGWAFGFGLERLAMAKMQIPDIRVFWSDDPRIVDQFKSLDSVYEEVSKYPMTYRDISFVVPDETSLNNYYEIVRDCADDLIEEVQLTDTYRNEEKFGPGRVSYTFRIVYRSPERTLTNDEVNRIQETIIQKTKEELGAEIR